MMIFRENHQNGRKFTAATRNCCLHRRGTSICNLSFHRIFFFKNIQGEKANSRTWKHALEFAGKED
jgi:hypothetical protein